MSIDLEKLDASELHSNVVKNLYSEVKKALNVNSDNMLKASKVVNNIQDHVMSIKKSMIEYKENLKNRVSQCEEKIEHITDTWEAVDKLSCLLTSIQSADEELEGVENDKSNKR